MGQRKNERKSNALLPQDQVSQDEIVAAARILKSASSKKRERKAAAAVMSKTGGSKRGGENRAKNLTPEKRREIARLGGLARQQKAREEDERLGFTKPRNKILTRREIGLLQKEKTMRSNQAA